MGSFLEALPELEPSFFAISEDPFLLLLLLPPEFPFPFELELLGLDPPFPFELELPLEEESFLDILFADFGLLKWEEYFFDNLLALIDESFVLLFDRPFPLFLPESDPLLPLRLVLDPPFPDPFEDDDVLIFSLLLLLLPYLPSFFDPFEPLLSFELELDPPILDSFDEDELPVLFPLFPLPDLFEVRDDPVQSSSLPPLLELELNVILELLLPPFPCPPNFFGIFRIPSFAFDGATLAFP